MPRPTRPVALLAAGAVGLSVMTGTVFAAAEQDPPPIQDLAAFCAGAEASGFTDISGNFRQAIECIAAADVAEGGPGGRPANEYGPGLDVSRAQMASFVARMMRAADRFDEGGRIQALPPYDGSNAFSDVPAGNAHESNINRLQQANIVQGGPNGLPTTQYGPSLTVSRAQMASFVARAYRYMTGVALTTGEDYYNDDEALAPEVRGNINGITSAGIAQGPAADTYNPRGNVTRQQMAAFVARSFGDLEEKGFITPLKGEPITSPSPSASASPSPTASASPSPTATSSPSPSESPSPTQSPTGIPTIIGATVEADNGEQFQAEDRIIFTFSEPVDPSIAGQGSSFRFTGANDQDYEVYCNGYTDATLAEEPNDLNRADASGIGAATCELSSAGDTLTVRLKSGPLYYPGDDTPRDDTYVPPTAPATLFFLSEEWKDLQGNAVDLANSPDRVLDSPAT